MEERYKREQRALFFKAIFHTMLQLVFITVVLRWGLSVWGIAFTFKEVFTISLALLYIPKLLLAKF